MERSDFFAAPRISIRKSTAQVSTAAPLLPEEGWPNAGVERVLESWLRMMVIFYQALCHLLTRAVLT